MAELSSPLNSSWLTYASYDTDALNLKVTMRGKTYTHPGVPQDIYDGLVAAPSASQYWRENIKDVHV